jgi:hypothetical protein
MVFPVVGGTQDTGYEIENSLIFNGGLDEEDVYLTRDYSSAGNQVTWTFSCWVKRTILGEERPIFAAQAQADLSSGDPIFGLFFHTTDQLRIWTNAGNASIYTNRVFRDVGAWYHIHLKASSSSPYYNLYINGVEETSFNVDNRSSYPGGNDTYVNSGNPHFIGGWRNGSIMSPGMYLANVAIVDGTAHAPTDFGETNDNGVWVPKKPNVSSWGTNGCFLEFKQTGTSANASGIGADTSGQGNHMSVVNLAATDVTTDTPTNNFCTLNPLYSYSAIAFYEGNLSVRLGGSNHRWGTSTFFVANGKWYFECKLLSDSNYNSGPGVIAYGIDDPITTEGGGAGSKAEGWIYLSTSAGDLQHGGTQYGTASAATTNDILMVAFDVDNGKIWIGKNGTWSEGSNPSTGNGAVREDLGDASSGLFSPGVSGYAENMVFNFGNPTFSISSGNADANGYGNFEYAVPSGFYSLCTKNLAEYG